MYINEEIDQYIAENPSYIKKIYDQKETELTNKYDGHTSIAKYWPEYE